MDPKRFRRIKEIFEAALQRPPRERSAFLEKTCRNDPALREEVEKLLVIEEEDEDFLERPAITRLSPEESGVKRVGTRIGPYLIKRLISSGGMGTVYKAEQEFPKRFVAVKVMHRGFLSKSALRRFEFEAQILARLRHPNITQVIESGAHGEGDEALPYFVMEFIPEARSLVDYAREENLTIPQRLELFVQVCDAVHYGHQKGIIHRDLKPGNILVDAKGAVKIIDFGVARATEADIYLTTMLTEVGQIIGTLQYMSPEQCEADSSNIDFRSDVYALGVVLYQLLCEELPYNVGEAAVYDAARLIREEPPKKPSTIKRILRGDMETIVLKALEKERARRFQSVAEFSVDIERFLKGEVISAKPAGPLRKLWKWMKRNPKVSAAAAIAILAAWGFIGYVMFWSYPQIKGEKAKLDQAFERIIRLSDAKVLANLEVEAGLLWPAYPKKIPNLKSWVDSAEALLDRLPLHLRTLAILRKNALPYEEENLEQDREERRSWKFTDRKIQWQHDALADLVSRLESLVDPVKGTLASVKERLAFAANVEKESILDHRAEWDRAIASIADRKECPYYDGLKINEQMGLVPLGRDPNSGLWEFGHLQTGTIPRRGEDGKLVLEERTGLIFVLIPGGAFDMGAVKPSENNPLGSPNVDPGAHARESPVHRVNLAPFFFSKYEMTQGQWLWFTKENPSYYDDEGQERYHAKWNRNGDPFSYLLPVEQVSWKDCAEVLSKLGLRLPSEAEWEYAARAGTATVFWTGDDKESLKGAANIQDFFFKKNSGTHLTVHEDWLDDGHVVSSPVGTFAPNPFGLHDVCGNLFEWCRDTSHSYVVAPVDGTAYESTGLTVRILRGGAWHVAASPNRSAGRGRRRINHYEKTLGIRPAASLQED